MTRAVADADAASRLLERTRVYVEAETPSGDEARASTLAHRIEQDLAAAGTTVERVPAPVRLEVVPVALERREDHLLVGGELRPGGPGRVFLCRLR